jgi:hypothetical protein
VRESKSRKGPITADELMRELEERLRTDPEYRAQVEAAEAERAEQVRLYREAEQPIVKDLNASGIPVSSVGDLIPSTGAKSVPYPDALPILLEHLKCGGYRDDVMENLGHAFGAKVAIAWWDDLNGLYLSARGSGEEHGIATALAECATKAQLDDLIGFLELDERGESRIYFIRPIKRLGGGRGREVLESLRDDPTLGREATAALAGKSRNR